MNKSFFIFGLISSFNVYSAQMSPSSAATSPAKGSPAHVVSPSAFTSPTQLLSPDNKALSENEDELSKIFELYKNSMNDCKKSLCRELEKLKSYVKACQLLVGLREVGLEKKAIDYLQEFIFKEKSFSKRVIGAIIEVYDQRPTERPKLQKVLRDKFAITLNFSNLYESPSTKAKQIEKQLDKFPHLKDDDKKAILATMLRRKSSADEAVLEELRRRDLEYDCKRQVIFSPAHRPSITIKSPSSADCDSGTAASGSSSK